MSGFLDSLRAVCYALAALALTAGCSKNEPPAASRASPPDSNQASLSEYAATLPHVGGPEGYTGSKSCQECHQDQFSTWHRTYHRTMTQVASREAIQADFNNVVLTNENTRFTLTRKGDEFWARMENIVPMSPGGSANEFADARIGLVTGSHHMQVFWVAEGHGNLQIGFPFTWLIPERRWVPRNSTFLRPPEVEHRPEAWNIVCSRCHSTGIEPLFDAATRTVKTRAAELGISCEACHGPGQRHVELRTAAAAGGGRNALEPAEIIHPREIAPERSSQICGFCHSMKWIDKTENWRDTGFQYRPGDDLEATTPIIRASTTDSIQGLSEYLRKNPNILADFFWSDGMVRVSGREYNGLLDSPCYQDRQFSCLSCHSGHKSEPNDMLAEKGKGNLACLQCHDSFREPARLAAHTRHRPGSSGSECYNCHMPHTTYGVLKAIRSHQVSSPRVAVELSTGRPNACNLCHLDKSLAWTANHLSDWFNHEKPALPEQATNISHAVRLALAGDAGQRALIAWHLGWEPALQVSGANWIPPVLGQLLDDPYAAVRCVAERSLRRFPGLAPRGYDFTISPQTRPEIRETVWRNWKQNMAPTGQAPHLLSWPNDLTTQKAAFERLLEGGNHRPVRLRE